MAVRDFSDEDTRLLREAIRLLKLREQNIRREKFQTEQEFMAPETYVARVPSGGIPALTQVSTGSGTGSGDDDTPGSASCTIYRILSDGSLELISNLTKTVYNLSSSAFAEEWVPVVRLKGGRWVAFWCCQ